MRSMMNVALAKWKWLLRHAKAEKAQGSDAGIKKVKRLGGDIATLLALTLLGSSIAATALWTMAVRQDWLFAFISIAIFLLLRPKRWARRMFEYFHQIIHSDQSFSQRCQARDELWNAQEEGRLIESQINQAAPARTKRKRP